MLGWPLTFKLASETSKGIFCGVRVPTPWQWVSSSVIVYAHRVDLIFFLREVDDWFWKAECSLTVKFTLGESLIDIYLGLLAN